MGRIIDELLGERGYPDRQRERTLTQMGVTFDKGINAQV
jgi:hypothetical protein